MIINLRHYDFEVSWEMQIDLQYVANEVGKKRVWYDEHYKKHYYIPFTRNQAKKICKLIKKYGAPDDIKKARAYILEYAETNKNNTLRDIWKSS